MLGTGLRARVNRQLRTRLVALADAVIADYRREEPTMATAEWKQAQQALRWAADLVPPGRALQAKLLTCDAHVLRQAARAQAAATARATYRRAVDTFRAAADLDSSSFDPYLGISRIAVYGLGDVDQAAAAIQEAEKRGYVSGRRERALLGDGYLRRATASRATARTLSGDQRRRLAREGAHRLSGLHRRVRSDRRIRLCGEESRSLQGSARTTGRGAGRRGRQGGGALMRVVAAGEAPAAPTYTERRSARTTNIETLGILACSAVMLLGLWLTTWGRLAQLEADDRGGVSVADLRTLRSPAELAPLLTMFDSPLERQAAAPALYRRAVGDAPALDHVGGLADVTLPAADIRADRRFVAAARRGSSGGPTRRASPILTPADIAAIKPAVVVRTRAEFIAAVGRAALWFFGAFWIAHAVRRWRRADDDPLLLPVLLHAVGHRPDEHDRAARSAARHADGGDVRDRRGRRTAVAAGRGGSRLRGLAAAARGARPPGAGRSRWRRCCSCSAPDPARAASR